MCWSLCPRVLPPPPQRLRPPHAPPNTHLEAIMEKVLEDPAHHQHVLLHMMSQKLRAAADGLTTMNQVRVGKMQLFGCLSVPC